MKLITVSGPPASGKTSVIVKALKNIPPEIKTGVVKFDCLSTTDNKTYAELGLPVQVGLSGSLCPDHFYASNIEDCIQWGNRAKLDMMIVESAGLCNRCSPHITGVLAVCIVDILAGVNMPVKVGPMLKLADVVVVTKGDMVSQAEREVFTLKVAQANPQAKILHINGLTGQGAFVLTQKMLSALDVTTLEGSRLRFTMPAAACSYCFGETKIGKPFQAGHLKYMEIKE